MTAPSVRAIDDHTIIVANPPGALGYAKRKPIYLVYVFGGDRYGDEPRPATIGKSTIVSPDAIAFKVPDTAAGREAVVMVRDGLVEPVAVGAHHLIELTAGSRPTVEYVSPAEAASRRQKAR